MRQKDFLSERLSRLELFSLVAKCLDIRYTDNLFVAAVADR